MEGYLGGFQRLSYSKQAYTEHSWHIVLLTCGNTVYLYHKYLKMEFLSKKYWTFDTSKDSANLPSKNEQLKHQQTTCESFYFPTSSRTCFFIPLLAFCLFSSVSCLLLPFLNPSILWADFYTWSLIHLELILVDILFNEHLLMFPLCK